MPTRRGVGRSASKPLSLRPAWAPGGCDDDDDEEEEEEEEGLNTLSKLNPLEIVRFDCTLYCQRFR